MTRRDRIRAALIYRRWSINAQMRWHPPYGWLRAHQSKSLRYAEGYSMGDPYRAFAAALIEDRQIVTLPRRLGKSVALGKAFGGAQYRKD